jgi:hypothetical protein
MLGDLDRQHVLDLSRLEASDTDLNLKKDIRSKLVTRYRERREPYVGLLTVLRQQQHCLALAA